MTIKSGRPFTSMDRYRWKQRPLLQRELGPKERPLKRVKTRCKTVTTRGTKYRKPPIGRDPALRPGAGTSSGTEVRFFCCFSGGPQAKPGFYLYGLCGQPSGDDCAFHGCQVLLPRVVAGQRQSGNGRLLWRPERIGAG